MTGNPAPRGQGRGGLDPRPKDRRAEAILLPIIRTGLARMNSKRRPTASRGSIRSTSGTESETKGIGVQETGAEIFPDVSGRSVLDIGAWDGKFSFLAEQAGASRVVAP